MPDPVAILKDDPENGFLSSFTDGPGGLTAVNAYLVNCADKVRVMAGPVTGLPLRGESFSAGLPSLRCVDRVWEKIGGRPDEEGLHAWSRVICTYREAPGGYFELPVKPGEKMSFLGSELSTQRVRFGLKPDNSMDLEHPVDNGDGADVDVGGKTVTIRYGYTNTQFAALNKAQLMDYETEQVVNNAPVTIPNVNGSSVNISVGAGQLRFRGWRPIGPENGAWNVDYEFSWKKDHMYAAVDLDAHGVGANVRFHKLYKEVSFAGILDT